MAAPVITVQPTDQVVSSPNRATFTLTATTDEGTLTYAWKKSVDGTTFTAIAGATSASYTTPPTSSGDNPTLYRATVSNDGGDTDSDVVGVQVTRQGGAGRITNLGVNDLETLAIIDVGNRKTLWIGFLVGVADLSEFVVEYKLFGSGGWMTMASAAGDFTTPNYPVNRASGALDTAGFGDDHHWLSLDVEGVGVVRIQAAGTDSTITGGYRLGGWS